MSASHVAESVSLDAPSNPYECLGVQFDATDDEIKSAYRKLVLKFHPDKNPGNAEAAARFQEVAAAHSILSDPEKRKKYDAGGMEAMDASDLADIQVDVTQMGPVFTTMAALMRKLGKPIKTAVSAAVLDKVHCGNVDAKPLHWGDEVLDKIGNGQAHFYDMYITEQDLAAGFTIRAACQHSKVKLLVWDEGQDREWVMLSEEDAVKTGAYNVAALYHTLGDTLEGAPRNILKQTYAQAGAKDPSDGLLKVLAPLRKRDQLTISPGRHLVAVYGDNFIKKSSYSLKAINLKAPAQKEALSRVEAVEVELQRKRTALSSFELDFKRAQDAYRKAVDTLTGHLNDSDSLLTAREEAYLRLQEIGPDYGTSEYGSGGSSGVEGSSHSMIDSKKASLQSMGSAVYKLFSKRSAK